MTKPRMLVGLIGAKIQGSMSPALFADAFAAAGIDGYYHLLDADRLGERRCRNCSALSKPLTSLVSTSPIRSSRTLFHYSTRSTRRRRRSALSTQCRSRRMAAPPDTISIAAAGATVFSKSWDLTAPRPRQWCRSAPAAPGAPLLSL